MIKRCATVAAACVATLCIAVVMAGCSSDSYEPEMKAPTVDSSSLVKSGQLTVGVDTTNPPLAGQSSKIVGIDVDMAAALADEMGLSVEIVDVGTEAVSALKNKTVDIVMGIDASNTDTEMWKSDSYLPTGTALFAASQSTTIPTKDSDPTIAVQASSMSSWTVTNEFGADAAKIEADLNAAFSDLSSGTVQYVAADAVIGSYAACSAGVDAYVIALLAQPSGYCVGCMTSNSALRTAVTTALATVTTNGVSDVVMTKWLGNPMDLTGINVVTTSESKSSSTDDADKDADDEDADDEDADDDADADETEDADTATDQ